MAIIHATRNDHRDLSILMSRLLTYGHGWAYSEHMKYLGMVETQGRQMMVFDTNIRQSDLAIESVAGGMVLHEGEAFGVYPVYLDKQRPEDGWQRGNIDILMPYSAFSGTTRHRMNSFNAQYDGRLYVCADALFMRDLSHKDILALNELKPDPEKDIQISVDTLSVHPLASMAGGMSPFSTPEQLLLNGILEQAPAAEIIPQPLIDLVEQFQVDLNRPSAAEPGSTVFAQAIRDRKGGSSSDVQQFLQQVNFPLSQQTLDSSLHASIESQAYELAMHLRVLGASIHSRHRQGMTLLMTAAANADVRAMHEILESGVDPTLLDDQGNGVLHHLAMNFRLASHQLDDGSYITFSDIIPRLVALGASFGCNHAGNNPLEVTNSYDVYGDKFQTQFNDILEPLMNQARLEKHVEDIALADTYSRHRVKM